MVIIQQDKIDTTLEYLFDDSKYDLFKAMKGFVKSRFKPIQPAYLKDVYLSISKEQGDDLVQLIKQNNIQNIVELVILKNVQNYRVIILNQKGIIKY